MRLNNSRGFMANHNFIARVCKGGGGAGASSVGATRIQPAAGLEHWQLGTIE